LKGASIFVNDAGTYRPNPFVDVSVADFDLVMNLNVRAAYFAAQAVTRRMIAAGKAGSIIMNPVTEHGCSRLGRSPS
jgi:NAD(P)-dependent dehydrogenase (short-subunit alcohol dehydrogenase family)